jgi:hypothetical protein
MSFSEQYQGTEWGQPAAAAPPPAPRRGRFLPRLLALGAVLAIVAGVAAGGWFLTRQEGSPVAASPSPSPSPQISAALRGYLKLVNEPFVGHLRFAYVVDSPGTDIDMRADLDMVRDDFKGRVRLKEGSRTITFDMVQKDGRQYGRLVGGRWRRIPASGQTSVANPFDALAAEHAMVDRGVVRRSGKSLYWLHLGELPNAARLLKAWGLKGTIEDFSADVYVTSKGVPVEGSVKFNLSTQAGVTRYLMNFSISRFGKAVRITAPIR